MVQVIAGEQHDSLTATYQTLEIARLNDTLKKCGILDADLRRRICEDYFFDSGYFLDSCWFADGETRYRPAVCFAEIDDENQELGRLLIPDPNIGTVFHEYAHGAVAWLFEDCNEDVSEIETGDASA